MSMCCFECFMEGKLHTFTKDGLTIAWCADCIEKQAWKLFENRVTPLTQQDVAPLFRNTTEFEEFILNKKYKIVAQKSPDGWWYIYKVGKGIDGPVWTLDAFQTKQAAVNRAKEIAERG